MPLPVVFALLLGGEANLWSEVLYQVTDLGTLGGQFSDARAVNDSGQVAGSAVNANGASHAFLYTDGRMIDLGTFGGVQSFGLGMNNLGQVTGYAATPSGDWRAFLYTAGVMTDLGIPGTGYIGSFGFAVNDHGQVTGYLHTTLLLSDYHTFLYTDGQITDLGAPPGAHYSVGIGIDDQGRIAGQYGSRDPVRTFLYSNGSMTDIGNVAGLGVLAYGMNSLGHLTGYSATGGFVYVDGIFTDLGDTACYGRGINDLDQVVGPCRLPHSDAFHAFFYSGGELRDLNDLIDPKLGVILENANAISNTGFIAATGTTAAGDHHGFLLTPVPESDTFRLSSVALICTLVRVIVKRRVPQGATA
jgi:probable HAF family extracellular repeat protein